MNDRSVLDNSLDKKKDWLEKLHKTLKESQHSTIVFTLQNESDFPSMMREYAPIITYDRIMELETGNRVMDNIHTFLETCNIPDSRNGTSYIYECIFLIRKYKKKSRALIFKGFHGLTCRIYTFFTPFEEERIGNTN